MTSLRFLIKELEEKELQVLPSIAMLQENIMIWGISKFCLVLDFFFFLLLPFLSTVFSVIQILSLRRTLKKPAVQIFTHIPVCMSVHPVFTFWKYSCEQIFACTTVLKR